MNDRILRKRSIPYSIKIDAGTENMQKRFRYTVMCAAFHGTIIIKMDDRVPEHARTKIVKARAEASHDKHCPNKTKHGYHIHAIDEEVLH